MPALARLMPSSSAPRADAAVAFLRGVLVADALASVATGLVLALGAGTIARWLGLPAPLLQATGAGLLPFALGIAWMATRRPRPPAVGVGLLVAANALWVLDCAALALGPWIAPSPAGSVLLWLQAVGTGLVAVLEVVALQSAAQAA